MLPLPCQESPLPSTRLPTARHHALYLGMCQPLPSSPHHQSCPCQSFPKVMQTAHTSDWLQLPQYPHEIKTYEAL